MVARAISSATISCGLVSIPVKIYTSAKSGKLSFNMMSPDDNRVIQKLFDSVTNIEIKREDTRKGYEYAKGKYVVFSKDEFEKLNDLKSSKSINITEFIHKDCLPTVMYDCTYYLGPDKSAEKAYSLLTDTMLHLGVIAISQWHNRGRDDLVAISPYSADGVHGLLLHKLFYPSEVRSFTDIGMPTLEVSEPERELACLLVEKLLSSSLSENKYKDEASARINEAVQQKMTGQEISVLPADQKKNMIDLMEQLRASLGATV